MDNVIYGGTVATPSVPIDTSLFANVIKNTVKGNSVVLTDHSSVEHELDVEVLKVDKNLLPKDVYEGTDFTKKSQYSSTEQLVWTVNSDGTITVTNTDTMADITADVTTKEFILEAGTYTFNTNFAKIISTIKNGSKTIAATSNSASYITFTLTEQTSLYITFKCPMMTYSGVIKPQIEYGSSATEYEEYGTGTDIDLTSVTVTRRGKNLLKVANRQVYPNTANADDARQLDGNTLFVGEHFGGTITPANITQYSINESNITFISKGNYYGIGLDVKVTPNLAYNLSVDSMENCKLAVLYFGDNGCKLTSSSYVTTADKSFNFTPPAGTEWITIVCYPLTGSVKASVSNIRLGTTATEFEPYVEPATFEVSDEGKCIGITPIYPTTILTNSKGLPMEVTYNADTKTYIDNKFAELSAALLNS